MTKKPSSESESSGGGLLSGQLVALRVQFRNRLQSDRDALGREHAAAVAVAPDAPGLQRLLRLAHGLHGVAASFGFAELGARAAAVEATARAAADAKRFVYTEQLAPLVESLLTGLELTIADV